MDPSGAAGRVRSLWTDVLRVELRDLGLRDPCLRNLGLRNLGLRTPDLHDDIKTSCKISSR